LPASVSFPAGWLPVAGRSGGIQIPCWASCGSPSVSAFGKVHALLWECRDERLGAVPVFVCHDEVVVERSSERALDAKAWLERAMVEGMDTVLNGKDEGHVPVEVEARISESWGGR